jgi:hypothetical protein
MRRPDPDPLEIVRRREGDRLLASAGRKVCTSRTQVASSIGRLARADRRLRREPSAAPELALVDALTRQCDLDVLLFFSRHPRALLTLDDLVSRVGYSHEEVRAALHVLQGAGLMAWSKNAFEDLEASRLYQLTPGTWEDLLPAFLWAAKTPEGRRALRLALRRSAGHEEVSPDGDGAEGAESHAREAGRVHGEAAKTVEVEPADRLGPRGSA